MCIIPLILTEMVLFYQPYINNSPQIKEHCGFMWVVISVTDFLSSITSKNNNFARTVLIAQRVTVVNCVRVRLCSMSYPVLEER